MEEQLSSYERLVQALIDAADTTVSLNFDGKVDRGIRFPAWNGSQYMMKIFQVAGEPMNISLFHVKTGHLVDAEDLTIASAYSMTGKFIALEANS